MLQLVRFLKRFRLQLNSINKSNSNVIGVGTIQSINNDYDDDYCHMIDNCFAIMVHPGSEIWCIKIGCNTCFCLQGMCDILGAQ